MSKIASITTGPRQSNFELLRIVAMFMVLMLHSDFWPLGIPTYSDFVSEPVTTWTKVFFESVAIVCVNVFVMISGWFGIKPTVKGLSGFIFQSLYFFIGSYLVLILCGIVRPSVTGLAGCFFFTKEDWFIKSYVALYILSPVLNMFAEKCSKRQFEIVLVGFFVFQTLYGMTSTAQYILRGYSAFSFIGLYLLARYLRLYGERLRISRYGMTIYFGSMVVNSFLFYFTQRFGPKFDMYGYINPLVIAGAAGLILAFNRYRMGTSKLINFVAKSAFAVYLLHMSPGVPDGVFFPIERMIYDTHSGIGFLLLIFLFLVCVFLTAIILDQPRKWLWKKIAPLFDRKEQSKAVS